jgi:hypothetical protein
VFPSLDTPSHRYLPARSRNGDHALLVHSLGLQRRATDSHPKRCMYRGARRQCDRRHADRRLSMDRQPQSELGHDRGPHRRDRRRLSRCEFEPKSTGPQGIGDSGRAMAGRANNGASPMDGSSDWQANVSRWSDPAPLSIPRWPSPPVRTRPAGNGCSNEVSYRVNRIDKSSPPPRSQWIPLRAVGWDVGRIPPSPNPLAASMHAPFLAATRPRPPNTPRVYAQYDVDLFVQGFATDDSQQERT